MGTKVWRAGQLALKPLTMHEIDRRLEAVVAEVAAPAAPPSAVHGEDLHPRWIGAAELARRVRPFLGLN
jgi:hypothetical protein